MTVRFMVSPYEVRHRAVKRDFHKIGAYMTLCGYETGDYWTFSVHHAEAICRDCEEAWARSQNKEKP